MVLEKSRRKSTTVYLDDDQRDALQSISYRLLVPQSVIIRRGIDMALAEFEEKVEILEKHYEEGGVSA